MRRIKKQSNNSSKNNKNKGYKKGGDSKKAKETTLQVVQEIIRRPIETITWRELKPKITPTLKMVEATQRKNVTQNRAHKGEETSHKGATKVA